MPVEVSWVRGLKTACGMANFLKNMTTASVHKWQLHLDEWETAEGNF